MPEVKGDERGFFRGSGSGHVAEEFPEHLQVLFCDGVADAVDHHEFCKLANLQNGADRLFGERDALILHEGSQGVDVSGINVVGHYGTFSGFDLDEAPVLELVEPSVDYGTGDVHLLGKLPFGGEHFSDLQLSGDDGVLDGFDTKIFEGRGSQLF